MGLCESKKELLKQNSSSEVNQLTNQGQNINNNTNINIENEKFPYKIKIKKELNTGKIQLPVNIIIKAMKSVCKIIITNNRREFIGTGTGFFMRGLDSKNYLVSNYHVLTKEGNIEIEIYNNKKMKLNFNDNNNRNIKYYPDPKDIVIYEIKQYDEIYKDLEFLDYDILYNRGYEIYKDADIFSIEHPLGENAACAIGQIVKIKKFEFYHDIIYTKYIFKLNKY